MATPPDSSQPPHGARSWSEQVARARSATPPDVDVRAAVQAALRGAPPAKAPGDAWEEFARIFGAPRVLASATAGMCAALPLGIWVFTSGFARFDAFARVMMLGGLPRWMVALVT